MILKGFARYAWAAAILACGVADAAQTHGGLRAADDLAAAARDSRARRAPIMMVFTQANCPPCTTAKRDFLIPLEASKEFADKVIVREVDVDSRAWLRDFTGQTITYREFSQRYKVTRVPTVIVMDENGTALAAPIVGLLIEDFYRLYLEQAIEAGLYNLRAARGAGTPR